MINRAPFAQSSAARVDLPMPEPPANASAEFPISTALACKTHSPAKVRMPGDYITHKQQRRHVRMDVRKGVDADRAQVVVYPKLTGLVKGKDIADPCIREGIAAPVSHDQLCQNLSCRHAVRNRLALAPADFYIIRGRVFWAMGAGSATSE